MKTIQANALNVAAALLLSGLVVCTAVVIAVGAVAGSGSAIGAVIGSIVGHESGD